MAVDPTSINNQLSAQLPTNGGGYITAARLVSALTVGGLTAWMVANFTPSSVGALHVANTAALQAVVPTAGAVYVRDGFYAPGDGGQATYTGSLTNCTTPDNGAQVQPSGTGCWSIAKQLRYDARIWGVKADYDFPSNTGTDNTTTLAAAITFAESGQSEAYGFSLGLPDGAILSGPQLVSSQIDIEGVSEFSSVLVLKSGSNAAMLTYKMAGYNFPADGHPYGQTYGNNFRITSQDGAAASATYPNADGLYFPSGSAWNATYSFTNVVVYQMPGNGVNGQGNNNAAGFNNLQVTTVGLCGINTNSTTDWGFNFVGVYYAKGVAGICSSSDGNITYNYMNVFSNSNFGWSAFGNTTASWTGYNSIDHNGSYGIWLNNLSSSALIKVNDLFMNANSNTTAGNADDIAVVSGGSGKVLINKATFVAPIGIGSGGLVEYNIAYLSGTTKIVCADCTFQGGNWNASPMTNSTAYFYSTGDQANVPWTVSSGTGAPALPNPPPAGLNTQAYVVDATACSTRGGSVTGGGSTFCPVVFTGSVGISSANVFAGGSGGTNGTGVALTVTGGLCSVQPVLAGTITGGVLTAITGVTTAGTCSVLPTSPASVTGNSLSAAEVNLTPVVTGSWVQQ